MIGAELLTGAEARDLIQPFQLDVPNLRGRVVRLGPVLDDILETHAYPPAIARLVAEIATTATLLASLLKFEGVFTLQAKGDGPVRLLVADVTSEGVVRAYAQFDHERIRGLKGATFHTMLGEGYLAFTVDQGQDTERYQGIVTLEGDTVSDALRHYFQQSEQLETGMLLAAREVDGLWSSGAIILQKMPGDDPDMMTDTATEDDWRRGMVLLATCTEDELLDETLPATELLYRLFHEEEIRVFAPYTVYHGCRCSEERVRAVMSSLPEAELDSLRVDGKLVITCEICNREYVL